MTRETRGHRRDSQLSAEDLAVQALAFLAGRPEDLGRFLAVSGIGPTELRQAARQPEFLSGVLDYLLSEEALLVAFAAANELPPEDVAAAAMRAANAARD